MVNAKHLWKGGLVVSNQTLKEEGSLPSPFVPHISINSLLLPPALDTFSHDLFCSCFSSSIFYFSGRHEPGFKEKVFLFLQDYYFFLYSLVERQMRETVST